MTRPTFPDFAPTVPAMLRAIVGEFGDAVCVVTPDDRMTYTELDERSRRAATRLVGAGVAKGTRVGLLMPNSTDWVVVWFAAARIGAITVPINTFFTATELAEGLRQADVQVLVAVPEFLRHRYAAILEQIAPELTSTTGRNGAPAPPLYLTELPQLRRVLFASEEVPHWAEPLAAATNLVPERLIAELENDVHASDELLITYTSGSSGRPKGVVHGHGGTVRHAYNLAAHSGVDSSTRVWTPMPLFWVGGLIYSLLRSLTAGGCLLTQPVFQSRQAHDLMRQERVTDIAAWPTVTKALLEDPAYADADFSALRSGLHEALPPDRRPSKPSLTVSTLGMSETCGPHTYKTQEEADNGVTERYQGAFGHPLPGMEHRLLDPDTRAPIPVGQEGELAVRGYSLMHGLYKQERSEVFDVDGWYHTGDLGYFDDGWFIFTGRHSDLIKTGGSNVSPAEVEACLLAEPTIATAIVVGVADPTLGQRVVALVVPMPSAHIDVEAIRARLRDRLASYKVPTDIMSIDRADVPLLSSQKVDRRALAKRAADLIANSATGDD
jgi:acyl-CoA synthetase (AMP-forming)/AMP-acid ligase II